MMGAEGGGWSEEEDSDSDDLSELEARLYSQYHYQDEVKLGPEEVEHPSPSPIISPSQTQARNKEVTVIDSSSDQIPVALVRGDTKSTNMRPNPLYTEAVQIDSESSEDEGIIPIFEDTPAQRKESNNLTINITHDEKIASRSESNKKLAPKKQQQQVKKKDFYVAEYGSDFSENFGSSDDNEVSSVDDESVIELEDSHLRFNIEDEDGGIPEFRLDEVRTVNRKPCIVPTKWNQEMRHFYSHINHANFTITTEDIVGRSDNGGSWELDLSDRYQTKQNNRYFFTKGRCSNCNQVGHYMRDCPEPERDVRCFMCGTLGHRENRCPAASCLGCGNPSHMFRTVCTHCKLMNRVSCRECGFHGHKKQSCPDLWRRYHNTDKSHDASTPQKPRSSHRHKRAEDQWCCNCGARGHLVEKCRRTRYSEYPVMPVVVQKYEAVKRLEDILDEAKQSLNKSSTDSRSKKQKKKRHSAESFDAPPAKKKKMNSEAPAPAPTFTSKYLLADNQLVESINNLSKTQRRKEKKEKKKVLKQIAKEKFKDRKSKNTVMNRKERKSLKKKMTMHINTKAYSHNMEFSSRKHMKGKNNKFVRF
eukprot:TRINITY_DN1546_c0_g1_i5.p1 TRINITY_DN1546_c0_g1~~TRINITY_DN1546_c0_g1_i5.p1  ORF type:complete len:589 (-),score=114.27 TRINITY_DN1546_c0_g1_i5:81-1847(-)